MSSDPRFGILREALSAYASDLEDPDPDSTEILQAAVALVVRGHVDLEVLLIKRARRDGDPWSGHMALPGGRRDPADTSLRQTAVRETLEETGIDLDELGAHLGRLVEVRPQSPHLPRISVAPHVFGAPAETRARVPAPKSRLSIGCLSQHLEIPPTAVRWRSHSRKDRESSPASESRMTSCGALRTACSMTFSAAPRRCSPCHEGSKRQPPDPIPGVSTQSATKMFVLPLWLSFRLEPKAR